ncbi:ABC transporter ATP-binding protein [Affinibrenneria salicis]|uniref:ABC transporter ATP-binding protein n=1 Tax=Affinibrenneria salicis TaxID=2590031 RepID=A0A5J5FTD3_9GAMM|nr:ABC transporter ATP-binding protein [Affinibrenneria salicis]KAA8996389.1 ABC transporter ATP-binding protein [Affinibrenneria salicis]
MAELQIQDLTICFPDMSDAVLTIPGLTIRSGEQVAVMGPSGSGKTTFINAITGLDRCGSGAVIWDNQDIRQLGEAGRDRWRARHVGLVMQDFHLYPGLTAQENVLLPARFHHWRLPSTLKRRADALLARVGLNTGSRVIDVLSRGEKQRVAVARALLMTPDIIVADEPTASLDSQSGDQIAALLVTLARENNATLITVTHDRRFAALMRRHIQLEKGCLVSDSMMEEEQPA